MPTLLPVLDLLDGQTVHAVRGDRRRYRPITSVLCDTPEPLVVADAMRERFGCKRLYVADLDSLLGDEAVDEATLALLVEGGFELVVDAATRDPERAWRLVELGVREVVVALETLQDPAAVESIVARIGPERTVFSLDLQEGRALGGPAAWRGLQPLQIVERLCDLGLARLIVLDLVRVGARGGWSLGALCDRIGARFPRLRLISGGGVRNVADLEVLRRHGVAEALVATALHDGAIDRLPSRS